MVHVSTTDSLKNCTLKIKKHVKLAFDVMVTKKWTFQNVSNNQDLLTRLKNTTWTFHEKPKKVAD